MEKALAAWCMDGKNSRLSVSVSVCRRLVDKMKRSRTQIFFSGKSVCHSFVALSPPTLRSRQTTFDFRVNFISLWKAQIAKRLPDWIRLLTLFILRSIFYFNKGCCCIQKAVESDARIKNQCQSFIYLWSCCCFCCWCFELFLRTVSDIAGRRGEKLQRMHLTTARPKYV